MDDRITSQVYETPRVVDYGDLQELTAGCHNTQGGDGVFAGKHEFGFSNPAKGGCVIPG